PAFLYVRRDLQTALRQPIWGWLGAANPFTFDLDYTPAPNIGRFWVGTPPVLSLKAIAPAVELLLAAGIDRLRAKSMAQTEYLIFLADRWLTPLGFSVGSPRQADRRGSHVSLRHPEAYRINRALIEAEPPALRVIPDFREPDNLRCGVAPLYNSFTDIHRAMERLKTIVTERLYEAYSAERAAVT
ncbi:MAG: kynureninase, partial [Anaerolineae bacterium]|nr:kynureninase [Anaerolineae bacterium]